MDKNLYDVYPLFPRPVYRTKVDVEVDVDFILNQKMKNNSSNSMSVTQNLLSDSKLQKLNLQIIQHLNIFLHEFMGAKDCEAYITQSWSLINMPGQGMHEHSHPNSLISGSYYFNDLPSPGSNLVFNRYTGNQVPLKFNLDPEKVNEYNNMNVSVPMEKNDLLLFPSDISHYVDINNSTFPRHSIAFNAFVRGQLGNEEETNVLVIQ